ncbi:serine/threonine-protein kinase S6KL [Uranotaenia lowii]|uniref:serine/threonine-protein kinase S6KL n=1 Tax=Uranotaenia lowii TaxID=190385 RepID=UPI00247A17DC|nr:serine/threonine-protein kinase S6KL [Uranotaenia lowii]
MGNRSSNSSTFTAPEVDNGSIERRVKFANSSSSLSPSSSTSVAQNRLPGTRKSAGTASGQLRRSVSLDEILGRLNESFQKLSSSLSCTALNTTASNGRRRSAPVYNRPWSRVSRKRWQEGTLADAHQLSKTCWPVTHAEALFLPHFTIDIHAERRYLRVRHLANGAFGRVYQVRSVDGGEKTDDLALKILSKSQIIDNNAVRQLKDECDIQTICGHHKFLAECVRYWQTKKQVYLLSKFYPNGELFQRFQQFPLELVQLYVAEIALALDFLHQAGIIYRDLKPENVLLDQDYHIRLIDFGLSKWLSIGSRTRTLCGTLQYMAPEILTGEPYGHAIDWWALGVLACRMYTSEYPYLDLSSYLGKSEDLDRLIERRTTQPAEDDCTAASGRTLLPASVHDTLPPEAQDLLRRLLEVKPQYRLRSELQLQRIGLYKNYNWDAVRNKQVSAKQIIESANILDTNESGPRAISALVEKSFENLTW